jgi:hypothetical protein
VPHQLLAVHDIKPEFAVFRDPCFSDRELILEVLNRPVKVRVSLTFKSTVQKVQFAIP